MHKSYLISYDMVMEPDWPSKASIFCLKRSVISTFKSGHSIITVLCFVIIWNSIFESPLNSAQSEAIDLSKSWSSIWLLLSFNDIISFPDL